MALEDDIKLDVRNSLRDLELDNQQYGIAVASAALAFERVVSVELDLLRFGDASVRDYLEAQEAFVNSLRAVAALRVAYILDRISLFIDLELLQLDERGQWAGLRDESFQAEPFFQLPGYARPAYGKLHPKLWYSHRLREMEQVPDGQSHVWRQPDQPQPPQEELPPGQNQMREQPMMPGEQRPMNQLPPAQPGPVRWQQPMGPPLNQPAPQGQIQLHQPMGQPRNQPIRFEPPLPRVNGMN